MSPSVNMALPKTRPIIRLQATKHKRYQLIKANSANNCAKKTESGNFYLVFGLVLPKSKETFFIIKF